MRAVPAWAQRIAWHNWCFAGFYLTILAQGIASLIAPPPSIASQAGPFLTLLWSLFTASAGLIGLFGAIGPSIHVWKLNVPGPNFRAEQVADVIGWLGVFIYASTVFLLLAFEGTPSRAAGAFGVSAHFWPFLIRWLYFHFRENAEIKKREVIDRIRQGPIPDQGEADVQ